MIHPEHDRQSAPHTANRRRFVRAPLDTPLSFVVAGEADERDGVARDISIGSMCFDTTAPAPFGTEIAVHVAVPRARGGFDRLTLHGIVRWADARSMCVQFRRVGALETHILVEHARRHTLLEECAALDAAA